MAFVLELEFSAPFAYITNLLIDLLREKNIPSEVTQKSQKIVCMIDSEDEKTLASVESIMQKIPASLFLKGSKSSIIQKRASTLPKVSKALPKNLSLCPSCQKELFDVSSRRYYYPFISCKHCGANRSFVQSYPYKRENSSLKYIVPCNACQEEQTRVGRRENHELISCIECAISLRMSDKKSERFANDKGSYRTLFEVAAKALSDKKRVLMKTNFGYRLFYHDTHYHHNAILMLTDAQKVTDICSLITEEFHALLSIERPILHVTLKDERLKELTGYNTTFVKYADEAFSMLLSAELNRLGFSHIWYEECDESMEADIIIDHDIAIKPQKDIFYFINKDNGFIVSGERVVFPYEQKSFVPDVLVIQNNLASVKFEDRMVSDAKELFGVVEAKKINVIGKTTLEAHELLEDEASFMAGVFEYNLLGQKVIGVHFDNEVSFLYFNGKKIIRAIPPKEFDSSHLIEHLRNLREGSDRLIENLAEKFPKTYQKLQELQQKEYTIFEAVSLLLELEVQSFEALSKEAMKFVGKGGVQIDMKLKDNRFDYYAFLASIISYILAGVEKNIIAYSIFESFGDYISEIVREIETKVKTNKLILCGKSFGNQSLFSRIERNFKFTPPLLLQSLPLGKESSVVGGLFL